MSLSDAEKNRLKRVGLSGLNKPKRTPQHPTKKAVVAVRDGSKIKVIRFGDQKMGHNYSPEARKSFKARHAKILPEAKLVPLSGRIKYSGLVLVDLKNLLLNLKNILKV